MDLIEFMDVHRVDYRLQGHEHCRSGWVQVDCPWCSPGTERFRLGIHLRHGYANCWSCGSRNITAVLQELFHLSYVDARRLRQDVQPFRVPAPVAHHGVYKAPPDVMGLLGPHRRYLKQRGFNYTQLERLWHLGAIGLSTQLAWRIFIPISLHGDPVSWTTRSIGTTDHAKYISAAPEQESIPHKHLLYGEDYCRHACVVVEGPADVWAGGPGFVATFGLSYTSEQVARIAAYPVRAVCFDNEPAAQKVQQELVNRLACLPGETYSIQISAKDPGEAAQTELRQIRREVLRT